MKKNVHVASVVMVTLAALSFTSCQKENDVDLSGYAPSSHTHQVEQTQVYTFYVNYQGAGQQIAESGYISRLVGSINSDDAVLVFTQVSTTQSGQYYWTAQPYTDKNGASYWYMVSDGGGLYFYANAGEGYTWTNSFSRLLKVVVIPHIVYAKNSSKGINYGDFASVSEAYDLSME